MPDLLDDVQANVDAFNESALKAQLKSSQPDKPYDEDEGVVECEECGVEIPTQRRKLSGSVLCTKCKEFEDRMKKMRRNRGEM